MAVLVPAAYDEIVQYLAQYAAPEEILAFKVSELVKARFHELLNRNSGGSLAPAEVQELELMLHFEEMMELLKSKALAELHPS